MPRQASSAAEKLAHEMRATARDIFLHALAETSIAKAFERDVNYSRGTLPVCDALSALGAYNRIFVLALGKAAHTMLEALAAQVGPGLSGIVAAPVDPAAQLPNFRYYRAGDP